MITLSHNKSCVARSCWKKYDWRYNQKLTPIRKSTALTLGSSIHNAFDMYYNGFSVADVVKALVDSYDTEIANVGVEEQEDLIIARYTAIGMFAHFPFKDLSNFEEIQSEKKFSVKLGNLRGVRFEGRTDGLVKKDGKWWVRELKTTGLNLRQFNQRINTSNQSTGYMYAMRKMGYDVVGTLYDYIKKPLLRKRVTENMHDFAKRIMADYQTKPDMYYGQIFSWRNQTEMDIWERDMVSLIRDMRWRKEYPRNTDNCYMYNWECDYKKICFEEQPDPLMVKLYFRHEGKEVHINDDGRIETRDGDEVEVIGH